MERIIELRNPYFCQQSSILVHDQQIQNHQRPGARFH